MRLVWSSQLEVVSFPHIRHYRALKTLEEQEDYDFLSPHPSDFLF